MEHLNNKTQHLGVMLRAGGLAAVVSQKKHRRRNDDIHRMPFPVPKIWLRGYS